VSIRVEITRAFCLHTWSPVQGARGMYRCSCGASGWRDIVDGIISAHKKPHPERVRATRRPSTAGGGAVPRLPTLDDYDRRRA
jgi:hypothetical protein